MAFSFKEGERGKYSSKLHTLNQVKCIHLVICIVTMLAFRHPAKIFLLTKGLYFFSCFMFCFYSYF